MFAELAYLVMAVNVVGASCLLELELDGVEEMGRELGRGAYGVVLELKVKGLRSVQRIECEVNSLEC